MEQAISNHHVQDRAVLTFAAVVSAAASYWDGLDPDDFCVQHVSDVGLIFGSSNRLRWSPETGFAPIRSSCTDRFLKNYDSIGPMPKGRV